MSCMVGRLDVLHANSDDDLQKFLAALPQVSGLVIAPDLFLGSRLEQLAAWALGYKLPTIYPDRRFAAVGGLMSYGQYACDAWHVVGLYTGRILDGESPLT